MEFVWMRHDGIDKPARFPVSAVPHWEGRGWEPCDPPARPPRPDRTRKPPATPVESTPVDANTTHRAPSGRKED